VSIFTSQEICLYLIPAAFLSHFQQIVISPTASVSWTKRKRFLSGKYTQYDKPSNQDISTFKEEQLRVFLRNWHSFPVEKEYKLHEFQFIY